MKLLILTSVVAGIYGLNNATINLFCYYDSGSLMREGMGKYLITDLEIAVQFCSHLVYGYLGLKSDFYQVYSLHEDLDVHRHQFSEVTALKRKYPLLKVLLSIGGDKDIDPDHANKYIELLESEHTKRTAFINFTYAMVRSYGFDGVDLAFQFPKNKPRKVHSEIDAKGKNIKVFTGDFTVNPNADMHKEKFTNLVRDMRNAFMPDGLTLMLTVLPNVNSTWYFDVPAVSNLVDFVNLAAFDFLTPERNPEEADFTAPLYEVNNQNRLPYYNADFQVSYWLQQQCPAHKLVLGMAIYGRAWQLTSDSGSTGVPDIPVAKGAAEAGAQSQTPGLLSWPETCFKIRSRSNLKGADAPLRRVNDPTKRYGNYAYRLADESGNHGIWISYEDPDSAAKKASYVSSMGLGGLSLFDLSYDDFRGVCSGDKYPILRTVKRTFVNFYDTN